VTFLQEIRRGAGGSLLAAATIRAACLDADSLRPRPLPPQLLEELARE
jgi:acyl-CoA thioesterase FadM